MAVNICLALGSNVCGRWGRSRATLARAVEVLEEEGVSIRAISSAYITRPLGLSRQPDYVNLAILAETSMPPWQIVATAKRLERAAGRRMGPRWSARPLDIDLIDYAGRVVRWTSDPVPRPKLMLPHPEAHRRGFVLVPMAEIAPHWRHPVLGLTPGEFLRITPHLTSGVTRLERERLDHRDALCNMRV